MKSKSLIVIVLLSFTGLVGCSSVPKPITHEFTNQTKVEAAEHWGILARDFANKIIATMMVEPLWVLDSGGQVDSKGMYSKPSGTMTFALPSIYLPTNDLSDFGITFRSYLITEITKLGYPVADTPKGAVMARWSVNKVYHDAVRTASGWPATGTTLAFVGYGIYEILDGASSGFPWFIGAGLTYDLMNNMKDYVIPEQVPHSEIVLTFTVSKNSKILSRQTQAYYVNEEDFNHYNNIADYAGRESHLRPVTFRVTN